MTSLLMSKSRRAGVPAAAAAVALVFGLGACSNSAAGDETERNEDGEVVEGGDVGALVLKVGDCLAEPAVGEVEKVPVVPCSETHDSELFHSFMLTGDEYPGVDAIVEEVGTECIPEFATFMGIAYEESEWDISTIYPTQETWDGIDDREVLCGVFPLSEEDTTGSARGIAE